MEDSSSLIRPTTRPTARGNCSITRSKENFSAEDMQSHELEQRNASYYSRSSSKSLTDSERLPQPGKPGADQGQEPLQSEEQLPQPRRSFSRRERVKASLRKRAASLKIELSFKRDKKGSCDSVNSSLRRSSRRSSVASSLQSPLDIEGKFSWDSGYATPSILEDHPLAEQDPPSLRGRNGFPFEKFEEAARPVINVSYAANPLQTSPQFTFFPLNLSAMAYPRQSSSLLDPSAAYRRQQVTEQKARTHKIAVDEETFIRERMRKKGTENLFPKYRFVDFIGKGTYGRVFQAYDYNHDPPREVAIKLMNVDDVDYQANAVEKDESLNDVRKEIQVLMQLKEHGARNVNLMYDVLEVDGQLWLVCEYCPGGSLRTLLRASSNRCEERYIRVIVRELAIGLQAIHEANIIHRDLKAANVMIHEKGGLQIIDFGVAGVVESKLDKRGTIIGTPYWMPPEQHKAFKSNDLKYGFEVDVWSYIVTIYEIATGAPPHVQLPPNRLAAALRSRPPRLTEDKFSRELCEFVEYVAQAEPSDRPSVHDILNHPYVRGSEETYPSSLLKDLVDRFMDWTFSGGQRTSLFVDTGAQAASEYAASKPDNVDFIFSTSRDLMAEYDPSYDPFASPPSDSRALPTVQVKSPSGSTFPDTLNEFAEDPPDDYTTKPAKSVPSLSISSEGGDPSKDRRVARGAHALEAIFDQNQQPYEYGIRSGDMPLDKPILSRAKSDLPLRNNDDDSSHLARKEVDVQSNSSKSDVELADADTIKQKRKQLAKDKRETLNMGWEPDWNNLQANMETESEAMPALPASIPISRPPLVHAETAPEKVSQIRASTATMNLDDLMGDDDWMSSSAIGRTPALSTTQEEGDEEKEISTGANITDFNDSGFPSYASSLADTSASEDDLQPRHSRPYPALHQDISPPLPAAMRDGAPPELVQAELSRLLEGFQGELAALAADFPTEEDIDREYGDGDSEEGEVSDDGFMED